MSEEVLERIRRAIRERGPITFAEFMELALYGPGGYYERPRIGAAGDFVTSPHVHEVFARLLARGLRELWAALGRPEPFELVEVGAGDGTLARQLLGRLAGTPVRYTAVERGPGAREALATIDGVTVGSQLPAAAHVVLANELLDNLPFRRVRGTTELRVGLEGDRLIEVEAPWDGEPGPAGAERPIPVGALTFVDRLAGALDPGYAVLIDYGDVGASGGPVHGYRRHRVVADPLADPGLADVTAGVDLAQVVERAEARGLVAFGPVTQREALAALGFEAWTRRELERQAGHLSEGRGLEAVRAWGGRHRASLLVDSSALGRLRWLVLASPGLPRPGWLEAAGLERPS